MAKKVKKEKLSEAVTAYNSEMAEVIITIISSITAKGQRKKLIENAKVKAILNRYGIEIEA